MELSVPANRDTWVGNTVKNDNFGGEDVLSLWTGGRRRAVVGFDLEKVEQELSVGELLSATLVWERASKSAGMRSSKARAIDTNAGPGLVGFLG